MWSMGLHVRRGPLQSRALGLCSASRLFKRKRLVRVFLADAIVFTADLRPQQRERLGRGQASPDALLSGCTATLPPPGPAQSLPWLFAEEVLGLGQLRVCVEGTTAGTGFCSGFSCCTC